MLFISFLCAACLVPSAVVDEQATVEETYDRWQELGIRLAEGVVLQDVLDYRPPVVPGVRFVSMAELQSEIHSGASAEHNADLGSPHHNEPDLTNPMGFMWRLGTERLPADLYERPFETWSDESYAVFSEDILAVDFEMIANPGDYANLLNRLSRLGGGLVVLNNVTDEMPNTWLAELGVSRHATLEFEFQGERHQWRMELNHDWVDPLVFVRFDQLIELTGAPQRLYSLNDGGQSDLFFVSTPATAAELGRFSGAELRDWRSFRDELP